MVRGKRERLLKDYKSEYVGEDRISSLPDSVLGYILSFLPVKQAVMTGVLSKRWEKVWTLVSSLEFDDCKPFEECNSSDEDEERGLEYSSTEDSELEDEVRFFAQGDIFDSFECNDFTFGNPSEAGNRCFMNFVDNVLIQSKARCIEKFRLKCNGGYDPVRIRTWINAAISRNVQELDLSIRLQALEEYSVRDCVQLFRLPTDLLCCDTLKVLKLYFRNRYYDFYSEHVSLVIPSMVNLSSLKVLHLSCLQLMDNTTVERLLSGCPVLEELVINRKVIENDMEILKIQSSTIKRLKLIEPSFPWRIGYEDYDAVDVGVVVDVPTLELLDISDMLPKYYVIKQSSSLTKARFDVHQFPGCVLELLKQVSHIMFLSLSAKTMKSIRRGFSDHRLKFQCLSHLEVEICSVGGKLLPDLLDCSPNLKTIVLEKVSGNYKKPKCDSLWKPPLSRPRCLLSSLEEVEIKGFEAYVEDIKFVEYLLINSMVLKKLTIRSKMNIDNSLKKSFRKIHRSSNKCQLVFIQSSSPD